MQKSSKPKSTISANSTVEPAPDRTGVAAMIDALFEVLERHEADSNEGMLALLASFEQSGSRILDLSTPEDLEHNRASLLKMLERARRTIDMWTAGIQGSGYVH